MLLLNILETIKEMVFAPDTATDKWMPNVWGIAFAWFSFALYAISLTFTTLYCLMQFQLFWFYRKFRRANPIDPPPIRPMAEKDFPFVTVQLPMYNEMYVVEKLLDSIILFDYPKDRYEIHVIDDSNDATVQIAQAKINELKKEGFNIDYIRRPHRQGFKAGALSDATPLAKGEFLAIFDADFEPRPEFLRKAIPYFQDPKVGIVQTRWEHINEDYSLITKLQALPLNVHFTIEQQGRSAGNLLLQFNGTAGIWRKQTIDDAGGWESDTLTEDLDLSIRAQLAGYKIVFLEQLGSPAELPAEMNAFKAQQHRWMKGGAESARKLLPTVWGSEKLSLWQKIQSTSHLLSSSLFLFVLILGLSSVPVMHTLWYIGVKQTVFAGFLAGFFAMIFIYITANVQADISGRPKIQLFFRFLALYPLFLALSLGMALHNSRAVIEGWLGKKSEFVRTPKFNIKKAGDAIKQGSYIKTKMNWITVFEGILCLYFILAIIDGLVFQNFGFMLFHAMLAFGYGTIFFYSIKHARMS